MSRIKSSVCYVVKSFPQPSESFIAEEAKSLLEQGVVPHMLSLQSGNTAVVHPSARRIIELGLVHFRMQASRLHVVSALARLFVARPLSTAGTLVKALCAKNRWLYFQALPYAVAFLKERVQFFHAHFADESLRWAYVLSVWTGLPYGVTTHRYDLLDDPLPIEEARQLFMQAGLIVTISEYNRRLMVDKYGIPLERIKIFHCGIDLQLFSMSPVRVSAPASVLRLLNIGRLVHIKGQDVLLDALAEVKKRGIDFRLDIIGGGVLLDALSERSQALGLDEQVTFLGAQPQDIVLAKLRNADIFVLPSRSEGLPVACMEAMATGVPVIATRISGIPELVSHMENGLLVEPEDVHGLADAICLLAANRPLVERMRVSARQAVESMFERTRCTRELLSAMETATHRALT